MRRLVLTVLAVLLLSAPAGAQIISGSRTAPLSCDGTNCTMASGQLRLPDGTAAAPSLARSGATTTGLYWNSNSLMYTQNGALAGFRGDIITTRAGGAFAFSSDTDANSALDLYLYRDAANILAQRNGTAAQTLRLYNTFTDASNYERAEMLWTGNEFFLRSAAAGTGTARQLTVQTGAGASLVFGDTSADRWKIVSAGHFIGAIDNTYDIGASAATRPRTVYAGTSINAAGATAFVASGANAQAANIKQITELHTLAAASTSDTTITFPANVLILGVSWRVTTEITGPTSFNIGDQDTPALYATGVALAAGTTGSSAGTTSAKIPGGVRAIRFTGVGGGVSFTAGVIRVTGYYIDLTAPTS